ncbi:MAG: hypothetical protein JWP11_1317 [Frankiales bacterium]|nr:hypothetical protein [Frankiales bacterium]
MDSTTFEGDTQTGEQVTGPRPTMGRTVHVTYPDGRTFPGVVIRDLETSLSVCLFTDSGASGYIATDGSWAWPELPAASAAAPTGEPPAAAEAPTPDPAPTS